MKVIISPLTYKIPMFITKLFIPLCLTNCQMYFFFCFFSIYCQPGATVCITSKRNHKNWCFQTVLSVNVFKKNYNFIFLCRSLCELRVGRNEAIGGIKQISHRFFPTKNSLKYYLEPNVFPSFLRSYTCSWRRRSNSFVSMSTIYWFCCIFPCFR